MGIYDRDYIRSKSGPPGFVRSVTHTAVGTILAINIVVWVLQIISNEVTQLVAASPRAVFDEFQLWRVLTANFAHDNTSPWHIFWNMLLLYFFGRELESMYGRKNFWTLYLTAGVLALLVQLAVGYSSPATGLIRDPKGVEVIGASGAVLAIVVVYALHFPFRQILLMLMIPIPIWLLCVLILVGDLLVLRHGTVDGVAHFAHLAGAAFGLLYKVCDLRWERLLGGLPRRRTKRARILRFPSPGPRRDRPARPDVDDVSERIERLLGKISEEGQDSLNEEEWEYLKKNSQHYRSPKA